MTFHAPRCPTFLYEIQKTVFIRRREGFSSSALKAFLESAAGLSRTAEAAASVNDG